MLITDDQEVIRAACSNARERGVRVGYVPTMGALHAGHLALIRHAQASGAGFVVVSIFVNPLQFGPDEDLERYPRSLNSDVEACRLAGAAAVYHPAAATFYPPGFQTRVAVGEIARVLEGAQRPEHFSGVTTVVAKLFNIIGPCCAVFGRKDYQQWRVIQRMTADLALPVQVLAHPIVREADGLALSSRNRYLIPVDRDRALALSQALLAARGAWSRGGRDPSALEQSARASILPRVDSLDYVVCREPDDLSERMGASDAPLLMAVAAWVGGTRLIDNTVLGIEDFMVPKEIHEEPPAEA